MPLLRAFSVVVTQAPLLQRAGPEVLDDDVGALDEIEEEVAARGLAQIERDGFLVAGVHRPEEVMAVEFGLSPGAQRVGRSRRLDLDDLGAHVAEQPARERPGDQRADLDDADAVQRAGGVIVRTRAGAASPCRCRRPGAACRAVPGRSSSGSAPAISCISLSGCPIASNSRRVWLGVQASSARLPITSVGTAISGPHSTASPLASS